MLEAALVSLALAQTTLHVGPQRELKTPSAAAAIATDGTHVLIDPGDYHADVAIWRADDLDIRSAGPERARLFADGKAAERKAIWVIKGARARVEGVEFVGCEVEDRNGSGIRLEGPGLELKSCVFRDNQTGFLTSADPESDVRITACEFVGNGFGDGYSHNIYVGRVRSLEVIGCWAHGVRAGHTLKSRAARNTILASRFDDGPGGTSSYLIDLPNGGEARVSGCLLLQGPDAENGALVSFGREGLEGAALAHTLTFEHNTLASARRSTTAIRMGQDGATLAARGNVCIGSDRLADLEWDARTNLLVAKWDEAGLDPKTFVPNPGSPCIDPAPSGEQVEWEYVHPLQHRARSVVGTLDLGAFEAPAPNPPTRSDR